MSDWVPLKLIALDAEDLAVISAHLQDAVVRVGDLGYFPREQRFASVLNRFNWLGALLADDPAGAAERRRAGLRLEQVTRARLKGIDLAARDRVLSLLAITFTPEAPEGTRRGTAEGTAEATPEGTAGDPPHATLADAANAAEGGGPGGIVHLHFSGDAHIELHVACIEAELKDLGAAWQARHRPEHRIETGDGEGGA